MTTPVRLLLLLIAGAMAMGAVDAVGDRMRPPAGALLTDDGDTVAVTEAARAAGLRYTADVTPADRAWIAEALARARPEAAALLAEVDGMVTLGVLPPTGDGTLGVTSGNGSGFTIDLAFSRLNTDRQTDRGMVVLHEFGHVVDFALVDAATGAKLDALIPHGGPCGLAVGCDLPAERFADTFAKWALRGGVSSVGAGYGIPAPASIETWGEPLGLLAIRLPK
jgi:hypothetical protein